MSWLVAKPTPPSHWYSGYEYLYLAPGEEPNEKTSAWNSAGSIFTELENAIAAALICGGKVVEHPR